MVGDTPWDHCAQPWHQGQQALGRGAVQSCTQLSCGASSVGQCHVTPKPFPRGKSLPLLLSAPVSVCTEPSARSKGGRSAPSPALLLHPRELGRG